MELGMEKILRIITDIIFPAKCIVCNALSTSDLLLCASCWKEIEFITEPGCSACGFPFDFDMGADALCVSCVKSRPYFDRAFAAFRYTTSSKAFVYKLKYQDQLYIAAFFARFITNKLRNFYEYRIVIPVPMHRNKLRKRLYNQSAILARQVAKTLRLDYFPNILIKTKDTIAQSKLNRERRKQNIVNSFAVLEDYKNIIKGHNVILIDDVYTTGATVNECSKILKKAGCKKILVVTMARVV